MSATEWHDAPLPGDMSDALDNVLWALDQMQQAVNEGRYRYERTHVEADLRYLQAEARRAKRQRNHLVLDSP